MEFLKFVIHQNMLPFLFIILILCFVTLSFYGLCICCGSKGTILNISDTDNDNACTQGYTWRNLLSQLSVKNNVTSLAEHQNNIQTCVENGDPPQYKERFLWMKSARFFKDCENASHVNSYNTWKSMSNLKEKAMAFQWADRWFCEKREAQDKYFISEDMQDLEESSLDLLICKLDSLVLTFKSSDASRSTDTSSLSNTDVVITATSERCLPKIANP